MAKRRPFKSRRLVGNDLKADMTRPDLYEAQNSLACAFIYFGDRTDLTPEERAAFEVARAAVEALCMRLADRAYPAHRAALLTALGRSETAAGGA